MLVDLFDEKDNMWVEGTVKKVEKAAGKTRVTVNRKGYDDSENVTVDWPNPDIVDFCGERLEDRLCDADSEKPETSAFKASICFTPLDECEDEAALEGAPLTYIVDNGK